MRQEYVPKAAADAALREEIEALERRLAEGMVELMGRLTFPSQAFFDAWGSFALREYEAAMEAYKRRIAEMVVEGSA